MHIVADENIPLLDGFFASLGRITTLPGRQITRADLRNADALLVRSVTRVGAELLQGTPVRFVGTCTIGTDHLDLPWLAAAGIHVSSAPGCNARGVVEYVLSCLLTLAERTGLKWQSRTVGIVGVGQVGSRLATTLRGLGIRTLLCDPLRAERGEAGFVTLNTLLAEADVVSCHVPLTREGAHATWHLFDQPRLERLRQSAWLINSSRGPVIEAQALQRVLAERKDLQVALDVWEQEPLVSQHLAASCALATPHIAGYSLDGKLRGTEQIYQALCAFLGSPVQHQLEPLAPSCGVARLEVDGQTPVDHILERALRYVYDVRDDDARMRSMLLNASHAENAGDACRLGFDQLRKSYPLRRENPLLTLTLPREMPEASRALLDAAGFTLA
ncbi:4-phosphoerythronate dehydrogenase PdxB [Halopseudomonas pelagia]|uniref:4-phosphoerythronate dehydrogenase PdxB n=1 Tax=Halopseudomonas pelagia TaxID=553151 RepID=UPI00039D02E4|nr:4-phosphoerythronate dehydrogenase PdxB [Halopseudomonas pelagia]|tara:strand:+ start:20725 stop:21888 length:1164 start_codon:yes stop_codon:yes gene_type:complete